MFCYITDIILATPQLLWVKRSVVFEMAGNLNKLIADSRLQLSTGLDHFCVDHEQLKGCNSKTC